MIAVHRYRHNIENTMPLPAEWIKELSLAFADTMCGIHTVYIAHLRGSVYTVRIIYTQYRVCSRSVSHMEDYNNEHMRCETVLLAFVGDRVIIPSNRDCRMYPCFELIRMGLRAWYASNLFYLLIATQLDKTRFNPESIVEPIGVHRWSRVLYMNSKEMRSEEIFIAAFVLFISEFSGAVIAMACSIYNAWHFDQEAGRRALRSARRITSVVALVLIGCGWVIVVLCTGLYTTPFILFEESDMMDQLASSFNLVNLILVGMLVVSLISFGSRVIAAQMLRSNYVPIIDNACNRCSWVFSGGSWRMWYIEQTLVCFTLMMSIWPGKTIDIYSVVADTPSHLSATQNAHIVYTERYTISTGLPIRKSCWETPPTLGYVAAMVMLGLALIIWGVDTYIKKGFSRDNHRINPMLFLQHVISTTSSFGCGFFVLYTFIVFTSTTVKSNCFADQTACNPYTSTPSLAFWLDRADAGNTDVLSWDSKPMLTALNNSTELTAVMSLCITGGFATATVGEDTDTSFTFVFVFSVYMMASAGLNMFFESMLLWRARAHDQGGDVRDVRDVQGGDGGDVQGGDGRDVNKEIDVFRVCI
jgi:hypothetical protein